MFREERFREEGGFDRDWHEGELREVVEERITPVVFENLIQSGKVKYDGLMVFLPRKTVGVEKKWSKQDIGSRNKAIDDQQFIGLASEIDACSGGKSGSLHGLEIANHAQWLTWHDVHRHRWCKQREVHGVPRRHCGTGGE